MRKIGFVVDSTFGYKGEEVSIVPLKVIIDNKEYIDGTIDNDLVVEALKNHKDITTSQPAPNLFMSAIEREFSKGYDHVIVMTLSKTLSGTLNSANLAKDMLENDNITIIDTESATVGSGYILEEALKFANEGKELSDVINYIDDLKTKGSIIFSVDDLSTLVKNGRLGRISGFIGNVLRIKPILRFRQGVLEVESKARGLLGSFKYIINQVKLLAEKDSVSIRIVYIDNEGYAQRILDMINELGNKNIDVELKGHASPVISAHIGLGGMGIYLTTK